MNSINGGIDKMAEVLWRIGHVEPRDYGYMYRSGKQSGDISAARERALRNGDGERDKEVELMATYLAKIVKLSSGSSII